MPHIASPFLESHFASQDLLKDQLNARVKSIERDYELHSSENKIVRDLLKKMLLDQMLSVTSSALDDRKIAITLVDIQNDFVLKDFALYAPGGENTITRNMALLDAFNELIIEKPLIISRFEIVTSQDAHILGRNNTDIDAQIMARAYGRDATDAAIAGWRDPLGNKVQMSQFISIKKQADNQCQLLIGLPKLQLDLSNTLKQEESGPMLVAAFAKDNKGFCFLKKNIC
jgi:hypothetical protein